MFSSLTHAWPYSTCYSEAIAPKFAHWPGLSFSSLPHVYTHLDVLALYIQSEQLCCLSRTFPAGLLEDIYSMTAPVWFQSTVPRRSYNLAFHLKSEIKQCSAEKKHQVQARRKIGELRCFYLHHTCKKSKSDKFIPQCHTFIYCLLWKTNFIASIECCFLKHILSVVF